MERETADYEEGEKTHEEEKAKERERSLGRSKAKKKVTREVELKGKLEVGS